MLGSVSSKRDNAYYGKKQVAKESLCALLCDDAALQKSASLKIASAIDNEQSSLEVLLSLVRGEPPSCMPSFSLSKVAFFPKHEWLESSAVMNAIEVQVGANTLRSCLQSPKAWERSRIISLRALLLSAATEPRRFEEILPHLVVGLKSNPDKQLTHCRETLVSMAVMFVSALPVGDNFVFSVLQVALANEDVKLPVLRRLVSRAVEETFLLPQARNILERILDTESSTPVFDALQDAPRNLQLGMFAISHFCNINRECLTTNVARALPVIERHISQFPRLCLVFFVVVCARLSDVDDTFERRACTRFLQDRLKEDSALSYARHLAEVVIRHTNVFRVALDAIVESAFHASMEAEPVYDLLYVASLLVDLQMRATASAYQDSRLPSISMDVANLLKLRALALHLTHCGFNFESDPRLESLLSSIMDTLSNEAIAKYALQFDLDSSAVLEETNIWADISDLVEDDHGLGLFFAVKRRIQSASDIVWVFNNVQRLYVDLSIAHKFESTLAVTNIHGATILVKEQWCLRDALKIALSLLTGNVSLHASAMSYISAISAKSNEKALFFVSSLVESNLLLFRLCLSMPSDMVMEMIEMNITILARIARHRLSLPVVYSAFKYVFGHAIAIKCRESVPGFYYLDSRWRCLMLRHTEVPSSKVIDNPTAQVISTMSAQDKETLIIVFRSLCRYRAEDALKRVNDIGTLFSEYPVRAIECCTRICKNDVMDFGVAYRVYIAPIFQAHLSNKLVVNAVGSFFCDYLHYVSVRIHGPVSDEDLVDLNVILPTLLKLTVLNDLNGVTAMAALLKSPLWTKLSTIRRWHLNQECDCYSLLDRIKKRQLQCTYAKLDQAFFEFDLTAFINAESNDDGEDISHSHCQSLLVSSVLDAESDATSRVDILSKRNDAVVEFNREIRKASRELIRLFSNSSSSVNAFRWFLEEEEQEAMVGGVRIKSSSSGAPVSKGFTMHNSISGSIGGIRWVNMTSLFKLYAIRLQGVQSNLETLCETAYSAIVAEGSLVNGKFLADVALLANLPDNEHSKSLVKHMLLHLKDVSEAAATNGIDGGVGSQKGVVYILTLAYMHCRYCIVTEFPLVVLRMLRVALPGFYACPELVEALYQVMGNIYRYTNLHFNMTEEFAKLFSEYLQDGNERPPGLGWVLGTLNFIEDIPRSRIGMVTGLINKIMGLLVTPELSAKQRALLTVPLLQYWSLNRCDDVTIMVARQLLELQPMAASDPCALFLVSYCHYMDFQLQSDGTVLSGGRVYTSKGGTAAPRHVTRIDGLDASIHCKERREKGGSCHGTSSINTGIPADGDVGEGNSGDEAKKPNGIPGPGGYVTGHIPTQLQEYLLSCVSLYVDGKNEEKDLILVASMVAHRFAYMVPPRTECKKHLLQHKHGWYPLYKELIDVLCALSRKDKLQVTIIGAPPKASRYSRARGSQAAAATVTMKQVGNQLSVQNSGHWGDESAALAAILQLEQIKRFLMEHSDLDCYRDDGSISFMMNVLRQHPHCFKLLSALTLCKPLKLALWDVVSFEETECNCERELVLRIYCLHGQANRPLLGHLAVAAKFFGVFEHRLKLSFLNCVKLAFWSIDFNSLRMVLSYIADLDDLDVLLALETLLESCLYLLKGSDGAGTNEEDFASQVLSKLLHPVIVQVVSRSRHYKVAIWLYRKALPYLDSEQRRELALAVDTSYIGFKCLLCGICKGGEAPLSFNECFAHLVTKKVTISDIVLYCYVNLHRHLDVMLHCIHVLNVNKNEQIILVVLALMALVAERNVASYLLELAFDGTSSRATLREELPHIAQLDVYEFLRLSRDANLFYYDTMDPKTLAKSANIVAIAPGMWKNCGLEATPLGSLLPMNRGRIVPRWLPKLGNIALDRRRQSLLPMAIPERTFESSANEVMAEHLLVDSTVMIMSAYKAHLVEHHLAHTGLRDVITFINARII